LIPSVQGKGDSVAVTMVTPETTTNCGADSVYVHDCCASADGSAEAVAIVIPLVAAPVERMAASNLRHRIILG
jgi:hypothetical protein